jgi:hypothetical protein
MQHMPYRGNRYDLLSGQVASLLPHDHLVTCAYRHGDRQVCQVRKVVKFVGIKPA